MLDTTGFDNWAESYDGTVSQSKADNSYPFAGYDELMDHIYSRIKAGPGMRVLDMGFGTGTLIKRLYDEGYTISGVDFSPHMIDLAREKMPSARLLRHDFAQGLPTELSSEEFDFIICTYAIHHLSDEQKNSFIAEMMEHLAPDGALLIGDVAFESAQGLEACRIAYMDEWDEDEVYLVLDKVREHFPQVEFRKMSFCSGVMSL